MRRILLVFSVAALMVTMMVASAMPAFADQGGIPNGGNQGGQHHGHQHGQPGGFIDCHVPDMFQIYDNCGLHRGQ
jgi:Spy/CpxP family protein refolding chaperone